MSKTEKAMLDDTALEAFFRAGRADTPAPSEGLMARIMADAEAEIAARTAPRRQPQRRGAFASIIGALGGWPAVAGMVTATVAGVSLGFATPDQINTLAGGLLLQSDVATQTSYELEDILPGYSGFASLNEEG